MGIHVGHVKPEASVPLAKTHHKHTACALALEHAKLLCTGPGLADLDLRVRIEHLSTGVLSRLDVWPILLAAGRGVAGLLRLRGAVGYQVANLEAAVALAGLSALVAASAAGTSASLCRRLAIRLWCLLIWRLLICRGRVGLRIGRHGGSLVLASIGVMCDGSWSFTYHLDVRGMVEGGILKLVELVRCVGG